MRFKIDWASLIVESKFTVFVLFFQVQAPGGGGLIFGGAILRTVFCVTGLGGLFSEFYGWSVIQDHEITQTLDSPTTTSSRFNVF